MSCQISSDDSGASCEHPSTKQCPIQPVVRKHDQQQRMPPPKVSCSIPSSPSSNIRKNGSVRSRPTSIHRTNTTTTPSVKLGRKGDVRMHRAVAARVLNPGISLFQALQIGGFEYANEEDAHAMDSENVTLCQRKNQLNRRLRALRQQCDKTGAKFPKVCSCTNDEPLDQETQSKDGSCGEPQEKSLTKKFDSIFINPFNLSGMCVRQEHESSSGWVDENALNLTANQYNAQREGSVQNGLYVTPVPFRLDLKNHRQPSSSVALASLTQTASSVGLTLDQLAVILESTPILSQILMSAKAPASSKQDIAVALFQNENRALFVKAMLLAGYSPEITANECSSEYLQVAFAAWHKEGERLEGLISRQEKQFPASMYEVPLEIDTVANDEVFDNAGSDVFADELDAKNIGDVNFIIGSGGDRQSSFPLFYPGGGFCQF